MSTELSTKNMLIFRGLEQLSTMSTNFKYSFCGHCVENFVINYPLKSKFGITFKSRFDRFPSI